MSGFDRVGGLPISIKLDIEGVRQNVKQMLRVDSGEYHKLLEKSIDKVLNNFEETHADFIQQETVKAVEHCIKESINNFFSPFGDGGKILRQNVEKVLAASMPNPDEPPAPKRR